MCFQAGNYVRDDVVSSTIQLISSSAAVEQAYITAKLWDSLLNLNIIEDKQPLLQVAVWCIGEYGDLFMYSEKTDGKFDSKVKKKYFAVVYGSYILYFF